MSNSSITVIYWDYENVSFSLESLRLFLDGLESIKHTFNTTFVLKCFCHWKNVTESTQTEIMNAGFELFQVPETRKNSVDKAMMISAINYYHQIPFSQFILISGDGDFSELVRDLKTKNIDISIICRKDISKDLRQYSNQIFFTTSQGVIFKSQVMDRSKLLELITFGISDAKLAACKLESLDYPGVNVFSKNDWMNSYNSYEKSQISPFILDQILNLDSLYEVFIQVEGLDHSIDFKYFSLHDISENRKPLTDLPIYLDLPESVELKIPIQKLPASELTKIKEEFSKPEVILPDLEIVEINESELNSENYINALILSIQELSKKNSDKTINLSKLNHQTCNHLGISPSLKPYKKVGYSTLTKAIESVSNRLNKKIKINKDHINW